jgi:hypothetical protein
MAGLVSFRTLIFLLFAAGCGLCQQRDKAAAKDSLPEAPSVQTSTGTETLKALVQQARLSSRRLISGNRALQNLGEAGERELWNQDELFEGRATENTPVFVQKYFYHPTLSAGRYYPSESGSFVNRATYAASSILITHDQEGRSRFNTSYVLGVLTMAAAHSAERPYWRRSMSQPFGDFGSTIGNDAGMNVFHEFEPGIRELVKSHEPRFVSKIEAKINKK